MGGDPQKWEGAPKIKAPHQQGLWAPELVALRLPTLHHTPCELEALLACGLPLPRPSPHPSSFAPCILGRR